jgi:predicted nicotinamide N-methyase
MIEKSTASSLLDQIESNLTCAKDLALFRHALLVGSSNSKGYEYSDRDSNNVRKHYNHQYEGFSALFVPILNQCIHDFIEYVQRTKPSKNLRDDDGCMDVITNLNRLLHLYRQIAHLDPTLNEELGMEGAHHCLSQLIELDVTALACCGNVCDVEGCNIDCENHKVDSNSNNWQDWGETNQDTIMEIQDLACEIASVCQSFPVVTTPFTRDQLQVRLPLLLQLTPTTNTSASTTISDENYDTEGLTILVNQVTTRQSAQKDVGFVMWPSAIVLSQWLVDHPELTWGNKSILELGAGCGLVGLVAAKQQQQQQQHMEQHQGDEDISTRPTVILSDFNDTVVQNLTRNLKLNNLQKNGISKGLDFFEQDATNTGWMSMDGQRHPQVDLILASDVICQPEDAFAVSRTIACALKVGGMAIMVSANSNHRFGIEKLEDACQAVGCLTLEKQNVNHAIYKHIVSAMATTSGFVDGMALTMYTIQKRGEKKPCKNDTIS